jgi:negative regulator of genetic competence, sporulation and motility
MQVTTIHGRILGIIQSSELKVSYKDIYDNDELTINFAKNFIGQLRQLQAIAVPQWTQFKMSEIKPNVYMVEITPSETEENTVTIAPPYGVEVNDYEYLSIQNTSLETIINIAHKLEAGYSDIITGSELRKIDEYYWLIVEISGPEKRLDKIEMELSEIKDYFDTASERDELVLEHTKVILPENAILQLNQV